MAGFRAPEEEEAPVVEAAVLEEVAPGFDEVDGAAVGFDFEPFIFSNIIYYYC